MNKPYINNHMHECDCRAFWKPLFGLFFLLLVAFQLTFGLVSALSRNHYSGFQFSDKHTLHNRATSPEKSFPWYVAFDISLSNVENAEESDSEDSEEFTGNALSQPHLNGITVIHQQTTRSAFHHLDELRHNRAIVPLFIAHHSWKSNLV